MSMGYLNIILLFACLIGAQANVCQYVSEMADSKDPCFDTRSFNYVPDRREPVGKELVLECYVENKSGYSVVWSHNDQFLSADDRVITPDSNVRLDSDGKRRFNLILSNLDVDKNGTYECAVVSKAYPRFKYNLDVLVPPRINRVPASDEIVINEGESLVVQCLTSGNPKPDLTYSRHHGEKSKHVAIDITNSTMELTNVDESYAGRYSCFANNGIGEPVTSEFQILVRFKPRVRFQAEANIHKEVMYTSQGKVDQIRCIIEGYPRPVESLLHNGLAVSKDAYTYEKNPDSKDQYILSYSVEETFNSGTETTTNVASLYECAAENEMGNTVSSLKVTPLISEIKLAQADKQLVFSDAVVFEWSLFSGSSLSNLNVEVFSENGSLVTNEEKTAKLFVKSMEESSSSSSPVPAIYHHEAHIVYKGYFDVEKLAANTTYVLRMRAKNGFNVWSEWSQNLTMRTSADESQKITKHRSSMHYHYRMLHHEKKHKHYQLSGSRDLNGGKRDNYNANMFENTATTTTSHAFLSLLCSILLASLLRFTTGF